MRLIPRLLVVVWLILVPKMLLAIDLLQMYQLALSRDQVYQAARYQYLATKQQLPINLASSLPNISAFGTLAKNWIRVEHITDESDTRGYIISLDQPIFNVGNWLTVNQASQQIKQQAAILQAAALSLMTRCARAYFSVLSAEDDLDFAETEKKSFDRQLEDAQQRFKVGLIAITGVNEAKAQADSKTAEVIASKNRLANTKEQVRLLIGFVPEKYARLNNKFDPLEPIPNNINSWVKRSFCNNYTLLSQRYAARVQKTAVNVAWAKHLPTVSLNADYSGTNSIGSLASHRATEIGGISSQQISNITPTHTYIHSWGVTATASLPIYQGGGVVATVNQQRHLYSASCANLEETRRDTESKVRQDYRNVITSISEVSALRQSVISSKSALRSTRAGFNVGTRTSIDVLDRISDLYDQRRKLSQARYLYITNSLVLKEDTGTLCSDDIAKVNQWLSYPKKNNQIKK